MTRQQRRTGIGLVLLAAGGVLAYALIGYGPSTVRLPVVEGCSLNQRACTSNLPGGGSITFEISPKNATATDVLELSAHFRDFEPVAVGARFEGVNMDMGQLEYLTHDLSPIEGSGKASAFAGRGGVFACSVGVMHWLVLVRVRVDGTVYEVPYRFETANAFG